MDSQCQTQLDLFLLGEARRTLGARHQSLDLYLEQQVIRCSTLDYQMYAIELLTKSHLLIKLTKDLVDTQQLLWVMKVAHYVQQVAHLMPTAQPALLPP